MVVQQESCLLRISFVYVACHDRWEQGRKGVSTTSDYGRYWQCRIHTYSWGDKKKCFSSFRRKSTLSQTSRGRMWAPSGYKAWKEMDSLKRKVKWLKKSNNISPEERKSMKMMNCYSKEINWLFQFPQEGRCMQQAIHQDEQDIGRWGRKPRCNHLTILLQLPPKRVLVRCWKLNLKLISLVQ